MIKKLIREPFFHFVLLGALIFALNAWRESGRISEQGAGKIDVSAAVIARLSAGYERQTGRPPDEGDLRGLVNAHIREEVLCREALALGLDRDDTIVRRRLAQKMEFLTDDIAVAAGPNEAALAKYFTENATRYSKPERVSFRHIYFSKDKRGAEADTEARKALAALEAGASDDKFGDTFLHGFEFEAREQDELTAMFGPAFGASLATPPVGKWTGPVMSSYGIHLVQVTSRVSSQPVNLEAVRSTVARDFNDERRRAANREVFERLKERYEISVDETALGNSSSPTPKTAAR